MGKMCIDFTPLRVYDEDGFKQPYFSRGDVQDAVQHLETQLRVFFPPKSKELMEALSCVRSSFPFNEER